MIYAVIRFCRFVFFIFLIFVVKSIFHGINQVFIHNNHSLSVKITLCDVGVSRG